MHVRCWAGLVAIVASSWVACTPPPPPRTNDVDPDATAQPDTTAQTAELTPVPAPAGLLARARAKNLGATMRVVAALVGAPTENMEATGRAIATELVGKGLRLEVDPTFGEHVALDAPVDIAIAAGDGLDVNAAISIGLTSLEGARAAAGANIAEVEPGVWMLGGEKAKGACAILQSGGSSPARLVCGQRDVDVLKLGPYLSRTVAVEPLPTQDIVAEIDVAAINKAFGSTLRTALPALNVLAQRRYGKGNKTHDAALDDAVSFAKADLPLILEDVKKISLQGTVDLGQGIDLKLRTELNPGAKSWFARTALSTSASRVPEILWKAPADASGAVFGTVVDASSFADVTKALKGMLSGRLELANVGSDAERKKVAELVDLPVEKGTRFVALGGFGRVTKPVAAKNDKDKQQQHFDRLMGWYLVGSTQKAERWSKWMKDASAAFNQPGVQKALKKELGKNESVSLSTSQPPKELGKGAAQLNVAFSSKADGQAAEGTLLVLLMPDGDNSWIAMGFDRAELTARLLRVKEGKDSLAGRQDLAALKSGATTGGAFLTLQSFRSSVYAMNLMRASKVPNIRLEDVAGQALTATDEVFASLPKKGLAPMYIRTSVEGTTMLDLDLELDKSVLDDTALLVKLFTRR